MQAPTANPPLRSWLLLRPHALTPRQFFAALGVLAAWMALAGTTALLLGFWPVTLACLLALAATTAGFVHAARHALDGERIVLLADGTLEVRVLRGTREECHRLPAAWLRVEHGEHALRLACHGRRLAVGTQLRAAGRAALAQELRQALTALQAGR